jgi:hypothetical protein
MRTVERSANKDGVYVETGFAFIDIWVLDAKDSISSRFNFIGGYM